jgi:hypothetical protein
MTLTLLSALVSAAEQFAAADEGEQRALAYELTANLLPTVYVGTKPDTTSKPKDG